MKQILPGLLLLVFLATSCLPKAPEYRTTTGIIYGTYYKINYKAAEDLRTGAVQAMQKLDASLSTFNPHSVISRVNQNDSTVVLDSLFLEVFTTAQQVSAQTQGAFDITVAPLVNTWGFGFDPQKLHTQSHIDSILDYVGYEKVHLEGTKLIKGDDRIQLDASAIAKGLGCDLVAEYLRSQGVEHYLIDIGGEMAVAGHNPAHQPWRVGVQFPTEDSVQVSNEIAAILQLDGQCVATSGNYRQFYYQDGQKVAHTIDPRTGYPAAQSLLSATVVSHSTMRSDAYATAFMVIGDSTQILQIAQENDLAVYLLYAAPGNAITKVSNEAMKQLMVLH